MEPQKEIFQKLKENLCGEYNLIDKRNIVLQIDIEGAEADLIYAINYQRIKPSYMNIDTRHIMIIFWLTNFYKRKDIRYIETDGTPWLF